MMTLTFVLQVKFPISPEALILSLFLFRGQILGILNRTSLLYSDQVLSDVPWIFISCNSPVEVFSTAAGAFVSTEMTFLHSL